MFRALPAALALGNAVGALAWGERPSVSNVVEALAFAGEVARDYGNGLPFVAPRSLFRLAVELTETSHLERGIYGPKALPPPLVCSGSEEPSPLGAEGLNFTFALPARQQRQRRVPRRLPPAEELFERLFRRRGATKTESELGTNFLWVSWVNFYFEDSLRSRANSSGAGRLDAATGRSQLATVYGRSPARQRLLRSFAGGKLRTSRNAFGEETALRWEDAGQEPKEAWHHFVLGDDGLNSHWGHLFWSTVYTLEHNRACELLAKAHPGLGDARLFEMARVALTQRHARVFLENFASDVVLRANGIDARLAADVAICAGEDFADLRARPVRLPLEYLHAYTFHELVPDAVDYGDLGEKSVAKELFRKPEGFLNVSLQAHLEAFYRTAAGSFEANNVPDFLRAVTIRQIEDARRNAVGSYLDYNAFFNGPRIESFEDLDHPAETKRILQELYGSVEEVEAYAGLHTEAAFLHRYERRSLVRTSLILSNVIPNFAAASCYEDPYLYSREFLTEEGLRLIEEGDALVGILQGHVRLEDGTPFTRFREERRYAPRKGMGELRLGNLADFVGLNELWEHAMRGEPEFQYMFAAALAAALGYVLLAALARPLLRRCYGAEAAAECQAVHYAMTSALLLLQAPAYTCIMALLLFSERQDLALQRLWFAAALMVSLHLVLYVADVAVRPKVPWFLAAHHLAWLLCFLLPPLFRDVFALKLGLVLDYFVVWEAGLYWCLFHGKANGRRFSPRAAALGRWAVYVYAASRLAQLAALVALFSAGLRRALAFGNAPLYACMLVVTLGVNASQVHVLLVFRGWACLFKSQAKDEAEDAAA